MKTSPPAYAAGVRWLPKSQTGDENKHRCSSIRPRLYCRLEIRGYHCAGSLVVWLVIVPGMALLFGDQVLNAWNPALTQTISEMSPELIFKEYAKSIGIGGIAMAGVIGIVRSWGIIKSAVGLAAKEMGGKKVEANVIRTQKDLSMKIIAFGSIFTILLILLFFFLM